MLEGNADGPGATGLGKPWVPDTHASMQEGAWKRAEAQGHAARWPTQWAL